MPRLPYAPDFRHLNHLTRGTSILDDAYPAPTLANILASAPPSRVCFYVVYARDHWKVRYQGHYALRTFATQEDAYVRARDAARALADLGYPTEVRVQDLDRRFRLEWTYLNDPFPPRG